MTDESNDIAVFISRENRAEAELTVSVNNRVHSRLNLRDSQQELAIACDGISVKLHQKNWLLMQELGIANIKDISLSGLGLITPLSLELNSILWIEIQQQFFEFKIMRMYSINQRLNFIGGKWELGHQPKLIKLLAEINRLKKS
ncbi:hypothetical protein [Shewanella donghaensis]|uniref:hypothetical protein n=1 Tax=Shewanella donghaensis TaxID=238836 RepID=UPI001182E770|nr:hypothetical protein [Shewanella donghaensis]